MECISKKDHMDLLRRIYGQCVAIDDKSFKEACKIAPNVKKLKTTEKFHEHMTDILIRDAAHDLENGFELCTGSPWIITDSDLGLKMTLNVYISQKHLENQLKNSGFFIEEGLHDFESVTWEITKGKGKNIESVRFLGDAIEEAIKNRCAIEEERRPS